MTDNLLERIRLMVRSHGFYAYKAAGEVVIEIPYDNYRTGETGVVIETARTISEAKRAIGY